MGYRLLGSSGGGGWGLELLEGSDVFVMHKDLADLRPLPHTYLIINGPSLK